MAGSLALRALLECGTALAALLLLLIVKNTLALAGRLVQQSSRVLTSHTPAPTPQDDIGDGSVFAFYKLPPEEQEARLAALRAQQAEEL